MRARGLVIRGKIETRTGGCDGKESILWSHTSWPTDSVTEIICDGTSMFAIHISKSGKAVVVKIVAYGLSEFADWSSSVTNVLPP